MRATEMPREEAEGMSTPERERERGREGEGGGEGESKGESETKKGIRNDRNEGGSDRWRDDGRRGHRPTMLCPCMNSCVPASLRASLSSG